MRLFRLPAIAVLLVGCGDTRPNVKAIVGATVVTAAGQRISPAVVVVKGTRVVRVGTQGDTPIPAGAEKLEAYGKFVLPDGDAGLTPGSTANLRVFAGDPGAGNRTPERILREGDWVQ